MDSLGAEKLGNSCVLKNAAAVCSGAGTKRLLP